MPEKDRKLGSAHILGCLWRGQSLLRILTNQAFSQQTLRGRVVDVGGGHEPDYFDYLGREGNVSIEAIDGAFSGIDFERDALPYENGSIDTVLCANVLEHVYRHEHLVGEMHRILKPGGRLIGFVPFLLQYHPDPHDYFRYTKEALTRLFADAGFVDVRIETVGGGPFRANFNNLVLSIPCFARVMLYPLYACIDGIFLRMGHGVRDRYPLGFAFSMRRP